MLESESPDDEGLGKETNKRKRGVRNIEKYKVNVIKKARIRGDEYVNYKGNVTEARTTGIPCTCRMKCFERITEEDQLDILNRGGSFQNKDEQDLFYQSLIEAYPVKTRRSRVTTQTEEEPKPKHSVAHESSFTFHVLVGEKRTKVCKKAFLSLYGIGDKKVRRLKNLLLKGKSPRDLRGQQMNRKTFPKDYTDQIKKHIESFPLKISHYSSKEIKYLDANLDIKKMYNLFLDKFEGSDVVYSYYYKVFKEHFNYRFGRPQIDTCCECEMLNTRIKNPQLNETAKRVAEAQLLVHKKRSNKFYKSISETKDYCASHKNALLLCFDYCANISLPTLPVQDVYYLRQLSVYPFAIHNSNNDSATFYLYHQGVAAKGCNEVCSFIQKYINDNVPANVDELYLYSDNCTGQNKNHTMIRFLQYLIDSGRFKKIVYRLPIRGHSYLPCDRVFGVVKRKLRRCDRYYTVKEVTEMIISASVQGKFTVDLVDKDDILDFQKWWPNFYKKSTFSEETKTEKRGKREYFTITSYHEFSFHHSKKGQVVVSDFIGGFPSKTFNLANQSNQQVEISPPTDILYKEKVPIPKKKMDDIKKLVQYVPQEHLAFYHELVCWPTIEKDS
ncbi:uncharacterized protein LOC129003147 [Macrosteles quadrilineatus]|uniref:uncharacterized protein LOC129003147 n=1 Tax=Macrosteles quadrilineatus TaxID=74068 RepID=UPI0023E0A6D5|nr:uncharacterized protein LOC129003147 [Macrosteles quadrilineatus]